MQSSTEAVMVVSKSWEEDTLNLHLNPAWQVIRVVGLLGMLAKRDERIKVVGDGYEIRLGASLVFDSFIITLLSDNDNLRHEIIVMFNVIAWPSRLYPESRV